MLLRELAAQERGRRSVAGIVQQDNRLTWAGVIEVPKDGKLWVG
jgi:hypothetical protein